MEFWHDPNDPSPTPSERRRLILGIILAVLIFGALLASILKGSSFLIVIVIAALYWYSRRKISGSGPKSTVAKIIRTVTKSSPPTFTPSSDNKRKGIDFMINIKRITLISLGVIVLAIILFRSLVVVPAGAVGVFHMFGKVRDAELQSGLHVINPLGGVTKMSVRTEQYTMSIVKEEGQRAGDDSIDALTKEGLEVKLDMTILYHLMQDKASQVYITIGEHFPEKIIRPEIRSAIREVVARYDASAIYSQKRAEVVNDVKTALKTALEARGIEVEEVLLRNVILPPKLANSIQEKLQAEQESQRYDFVLTKEKKEADRKRIEAEGQRDSQKTISESLTPSYLEYLYIQGLKDRQGTIYVPTSPNTGLPLFKGVTP